MIIPSLARGVRTLGENGLRLIPDTFNLKP